MSHESKVSGRTSIETTMTVLFECLKLTVILIIPLRVVICPNEDHKVILNMI